MKVHGDVSKIGLPHGNHFIVDKNLSFLNKYKWCLRAGYPSRTIQIDQKRYFILIHHVVILLWLRRTP